MLRPRADQRERGRVVAVGRPKPETHEGRAFLIHSDPERTCGLAYDTRGRACCEFKITREGKRVTAIHAADVLFRR